MDAFMDNLWDNIMVAVHFCTTLLDQLLAPFHVFGPVFILTLLAFVTVLVTKVLNRVIITKRYVTLEKEFQHWFKIREEAMKGEDYDKAKRLARNIDQAKLNRVYYDYFLEGFLLGLVRNVLPIFLMLTYVNESFRAERLDLLFGKEYLFKLPSTSNSPILVGSVFYFVMILLLIYLVWYTVKKVIRKKNRVDTSLN
ncbi:MAG: hypothetical protein DSY89_06370 [Deltaproteobacteria bacterium]|nr:MAG: hypothetical protein DSY89_06370 [Deltaproteobacteria bacterium]